MDSEIINYLIPYRKKITWEEQGRMHVKFVISYSLIQLKSGNIMRKSGKN